MKKTLFVKLNVSKSSGYVSIGVVARNKEELKQKYKEKRKILEKHNVENLLSLDEFREEFHKVRIEYDGRKNMISEEKVLQTLEEKGKVEKIGEGGALGNYYKKAKLGGENKK